MITILTIKNESDCTGTEFVGIREQNGSYIAFSTTRSKRFKTLSGARRRLKKIGYDVK